MTRMLRAAVLLCLALVFTTACTGDGAASEFDDAFRDDPAVASLELTSHDNQPFTGGVSGVLHARAGLTDDEVTDLVDRVSSYTAAHTDSMRGRVAVVADEVTMTVAGDTEGDARDARLLLTLRADERVVAATVAEHLAVTAGDALDARDLITMLWHEPTITASVRTITVDTADGAISVTGDPVSTALSGAVWDAAAQVAELSGIRADDTRIVLRLAHEGDLAAATAAARGALAGSPIRLAVESDRIRLGSDATGDAARALLTDLTTADAARIAFLWTDDHALQVNAESMAELTALAAALVGPATSSFDTVAIRFADSPETSLTLPEGDAGRWADAAAALLDEDAVTALATRPASVEVTLTALSDADLARFAPSLRTLADEGARVCLSRPTDSVCVTAADRIDPASVPAKARDFVDAWNAAS